ncbi:hypothetical protein SAMN05444161_1646 [Rhizobiales bacterium GAS191]|nr:hypothetical protein SAMN05444161_1646 [Rhizobiales bacterium GAS191]
MPQIFISDDAIAKIKKHHEYVTLLNEADDMRFKIPLLWFAFRTYSTLKSGEIIEHGPIFTLRSINISEAGEHILIQLKDGFRMALRPAETFSGGVHRIGVKNGMLTTIPGHELKWMRKGRKAVVFRRTFRADDK